MSSLLSVIVTGLLSAVFLTALAAVQNSEADAGIYNAQSILSTEADEGISGAISGSADWRTGNVNFLSLTLAPLARYRSGEHLIIAMGKANHKTSNDTTIVSRSFEHLRYRYQFSKAILGEVFMQHEFDATKRINLRALVGVGPNIKFVDNERYGLQLGVSYMLEFERLQDDDAGDAGVTDLQHRNSSYLVAHYQFDERVQLAGSMYVQPRLTDFGDTRVLGDISLTFKLTKRLSFTNSFTIAYDRRPPDTIETLDTALKSSLTIEI